MTGQQRLPLNLWVRRHRQLLTVIAAAVLMAAAWLVQIGANRGWAGSVAPAVAAEQIYTGFMLAAALAAGLPIAKEAWGRLLARQFSIPLLVTVAAVGAVWIGEAWEAAAVTFLYALGGYLENRTLARTRQALRGLVDAVPRTARVLREGELTVVPAATVQAGETVVVLAGDRVPVDGVVTKGRATLDTSALTGEYMPVEANTGISVLGGSVNQGGQIEVLAQRVGADTTFSRLIHLVTEAQEQKPAVQRFLDRFARWYTPAIMLTALALYLLTRDGRLALTFLVIGCPGALVVAAPVATVAGLGRAARQGMLIKGGQRLERIGKVDVIAFDKTGTLTAGRPQVTGIHPFPAAKTLCTDAADGAPAPQPNSNGLHHTARQILALAAAAEQRSEHPLAAAVLAYAEKAGVAPAPARDWQVEPGRGALATSDQGLVLVGNRRLLESRGIHLSPAEEGLVAAREAQGETIALVAVGGQAVGFMSIGDTLRPEAVNLVAALRQAGIKRTVMLTGDNEGAARQVADRLGIDEVHAGLLPEDKVAAIRRLQRAGHVVAMVGDGINDAPALATADVSIAMGQSGTQVAIETADIALMQDRLQLVPEAIGFSRRIMRIIRQNVVFATAVVLVLLAGVIGKVIFLSGGMLIHEASVLLVIANGMRLLGGGKKTPPAPRQRKRPLPPRKVQPEPR